MRRFYNIFPIRDALRPELSWTHYRSLMRVEDEEARAFYFDEAVKCGWSSRQLDRQINSFYYQRILASKDKKSVSEEINELEPKPEYMMNEGDNPPIGIVLCADKSDTLVEYTLPEDNKQIFAAKYLPYMPTKDELKRELNIEDFEKKDLD